MKLKYFNFLNLSSQCGGQHKRPLASKYSAAAFTYRHNYVHANIKRPREKQK